ncbi:MAG TPA: hypothetical protein VHD87_02135 [Acidimicrobiales bacterium]|nr:hypothetical protein [Acidimicrobiales bacterium]
MVSRTKPMRIVIALGGDALLREEHLDHVRLAAGAAPVTTILAEVAARYQLVLTYDNDLAAALLAKELNADAVVFATDVPAVAVDWGTARSRDIRQATPQHLRALSFDPGSMGPKVEAACRFVDGGGAWAAIGALDDLAAVIAGDAGTRITPSPGPITYRSRRPAAVSAQTPTVSEPLVRA